MQVNNSTQSSVFVCDFDDIKRCGSELYTNISNYYNEFGFSESFSVVHYIDTITDITSISKHFINTLINQ